MSREKKAETVMNDFVTLMGQYAGADGNVDEAGFISYYADANAVLPVEREAYFIDLILKTWGIQASASGASVAAPRLAEIDGGELFVAFMGYKSPSCWYILRKF